MGKQNKKKYRYRKRIFMNEDYESTTFVVAIVENAKQHKKKGETGACSGGKLIFENPFGWVTLDFEVDMPDQVEESLSKIRKFEALLKKFRKAIKKEAKIRKKLSYEHIEDEIVK